jgi:hypothetical protein
MAPQWKQRMAVMRVAHPRGRFLEAADRIYAFERNRK